MSAFKVPIKSGLNEYYGKLKQTVEGLTPEELLWQPGPESNHILWTVWHMARVSDRCPGGAKDREPSCQTRPTSKTIRYWGWEPDRMGTRTENPQADRREYQALPKRQGWVPAPDR